MSRKDRIDELWKLYRHINEMIKNPTMAQPIDYISIIYLWHKIVSQGTGMTYGEVKEELEALFNNNEE